MTDLCLFNEQILRNKTCFWSKIIFLFLSACTVHKSVWIVCFCNIRCGRRLVSTCSAFHLDRLVFSTCGTQTTDRLSGPSRCFFCVVCGKLSLSY